MVGGPSEQARAPDESAYFGSLDRNSAWFAAFAAPLRAGSAVSPASGTETAIAPFLSGSIEGRNAGGQRRGVLRSLQSARKLGLAPLVRVAASGLAHSLDQRFVAGIEFPCTLDSLLLGRKHIARSLGAAAPHGVIALWPTFDEELFLTHLGTSFRFGSGTGPSPAGCRSIRRLRRSARRRAGLRAAPRQCLPVFRCGDRPYRSCSPSHRGSR